MKQFLCSIVALILVAGAATSHASAQSGAASSKTSMTSRDSMMYALGMQIGRSLKDQGLDVNVEKVAEGMRDYYAGKPKLSDKEFQSCMNNLQQEAMQKMQAEQSAKGAENKERGSKFLAENKKNADVKVTASGLQYKVIKEGAGKKPSRENTVKVHYTGKTIDGKVFDSSVERGEPIEFPLSGVIKGWTEGVQLMSIGSKFMFYIPSDLAYGEQGAGQAIGPNETLIFEVELLDITK